MTDELRPLFQDPGTAGNLQALLSLLGQELHHFARVLTGSANSADDAVHDTLVELLKLGRRAGEIQNPRAWLFTVVRRKALAYTKSRHVSLVENFSQSVEGEPAARLMLEEILQTLSAEEQEVVLLHLWEGLTFQEISEVLGKPRGTLLSRYHRCIQQVRERFGDVSDVATGREMSVL